ncbi:hypothetical protein CDAR_241811 [Caerostris darwini]|uniref:Uncharacterized protein n=1 Tax=Caerostris darwini TaxID=1538125 RepID=A0AAV4NPP3_9ARAC|nr:hypothetical protein CDAR_241811 [Caerostris darwini]
MKGRTLSIRDVVAIREIFNGAVLNDETWIGCLATEKRQPSSYSTSSVGFFPMFLLPTLPPSLANCQSGAEMDSQGRVTLQRLCDRKF